MNTYIASGCTSEHCILDTGTKSGSCCTSGQQCGQDEGDCDSDTDCLDGYVCGTDNCPSPFPLIYDCCTSTTTTTTTTTEASIGEYLEFELKNIFKGSTAGQKISKIPGQINL